MGVHAIAQVLLFPSAKPPSAGFAANALVPTPSYEELDRQARGGVIQRSIEDSERPGARLQRRREDLLDLFERRRSGESGGPANDKFQSARRSGSGEFGLHIAADPHPERVQHSTPFVAQLIGQSAAQAGISAGAALNAGVAAYDGAAARAETYFGAHAPVEFHV